MSLNWTWCPAFCVQSHVYFRLCPPKRFYCSVPQRQCALRKAQSEIMDERQRQTALRIYEERIPRPKAEVARVIVTPQNSYIIALKLGFQGQANFSALLNLFSHLRKSPPLPDVLHYHHTHALIKLAGSQIEEASSGDQGPTWKVNTLDPQFTSMPNRNKAVQEQQ